MMLRYKSNKKAFFIAVLIILLCLVSLSGATYALFTGESSDGKIGVITTAGYIKVDIVDSFDTEKSLVNEALEFQTLSNSTQILFEPGAFFITQGFKIKNSGNIPIKFHLYVGKDKIVDIDGQPVDIDLFNAAFDVLITDDPGGIDTAAPLGEFYRELGGNSVSEETYYLVVRMKDTADNRFQGKAYEGIGVTVYAVQGNADILPKE